MSSTRPRSSATRAQSRRLARRVPAVATGDPVPRTAGQVVSRDFPRADDAGHRGVIEAVGVGASRRLLRCSRASRTPSAAITVSIGTALSGCQLGSSSPQVVNPHTAAREVPGPSAAADSILTGTPNRSTPRSGSSSASPSASNPPTPSSRWPCSASAATAPPYSTENDPRKTQKSHNSCPFTGQRLGQRQRRALARCDRIHLTSANFSCSLAVI